jgi:pimeloyl-ACP methyl ester carboxylesterase
MPESIYFPKRESHGSFLPVRGMRYHMRFWGHAGLAYNPLPPLVMAHGWMDLGASFQFIVDALAALEGEQRLIVAFDWRGFGLSERPSTDSYWFPDYLGDLDAILDALWPKTAVDLLGHSMGANAVMLYAGVRPQRVRRLVNLEGFGMPPTEPQQAPLRYAQWLDELKAPATLRPLAGREAVVRHLRKNNPLLREDRAQWLAAQWARQKRDGYWAVQADGAHKRVNPVLSRREEVLACWRCITAPVLFIEGDRTKVFDRWQGRYTREDVEQRLQAIATLKRCTLSPAGHMLHHDQPEDLAQQVKAFLDAA